MSHPEADDGLTKFQRSRRDRSMTLLRVGRPDPAAEVCQVEARRQAALLRDAPEETEALRFIEAAMPWPEA